MTSRTASRLAEAAPCYPAPRVHRLVPSWSSGRLLPPFRVSACATRSPAPSHRHPLLRPAQSTAGIPGGGSRSARTAPLGRDPALRLPAHIRQTNAHTIPAPLPRHLSSALRCAAPRPVHSPFPRRPNATIRPPLSRPAPIYPPRTPSELAPLPPCPLLPAALFSFSICIHPAHLIPISAAMPAVPMTPPRSTSNAQPHPARLVLLAAQPPARSCLLASWPRRCQVRRAPCNRPPAVHRSLVPVAPC